MNARKTLVGLAGVALIAATGIFAASCGSSGNPTPATSGSSSGGSGSSTGASAGTGSGGSGTTSGATGASAGASGGASGATSGGSGATSGASGASGSSMGAPDGGLDSGDGGATMAACNPDAAIYPSGNCVPCAPVVNQLNACSAFNVTCVSFDNSVVPDAHF